MTASGGDGHEAHEVHARELARRSRLYAALSHINQLIARTPTRDRLFHQVCQILVEHGGLRAAWIGWYVAGSEELTPVAHCGDEDGYLRVVHVHAGERPEGGGTAYRSGQAYICNALLTDPAMRPWRPEIERRGLGASAAFPVREGGRVCGVLTVYADVAGFFRDEEIALLTETSGDLSFALDNLGREAARTRAEEALAASEARYRTLFEYAPDGILIADSESTYVDANPGICAMLGYTHEELVGRHASDVVSPFEIPHIGRALEVIKNGSKGEYHREWQLRRKDGSVFAADVKATVMPDGKLLGVIRDVTARKDAERALTDLNESLEHRVAVRTEEVHKEQVRAEAADRLKSTFLATMSHELRTPLNSIIGFTGIVLQGLAGPLTPEQEKQLGMVRSSAWHLLALINDVLDLSKIEAEQLEVRAERFDLRAAIARVMATVSPLAEKKSLALTAAVSPALGELVSDRRRVEQILLNLLTNAIKFTDRGTVTLTADVVDAHSGAPDGAAGAAVRLRVSDTGIGVRPEDLATLFQPFRQLDTGIGRQHEGTGLGLVICRRLTALLGGEISAASEWSKGSAFTVTLPAPPGVAP